MSVVSRLKDGSSPVESSVSIDLNLIDRPSMASEHRNDNLGLALRTTSRTHQGTSPARGLDPRYSTLKRSTDLLAIVKFHQSPIRKFEGDIAPCAWRATARSEIVRDHFTVVSDEQHSCQCTVSIGAVAKRKNRALGEHTQAAAQITEHSQAVDREAE
jgi:hypothetical protein